MKSLKEIWQTVKGQKITAMEFYEDENDVLKGVHITLENGAVLHFTYEAEYAEREWFEVDVTDGPESGKELSFALDGDS